MKLAVIICAAGSSTRYRAAARAEANLADTSKLDEDLAGRPVLQRTVELFTKRPEVASIVVAGPASDDEFEAFRLRHADKLSVLGVSLVRGGAEHRWQTVAAALDAIPDDTTHVAVHDAARPGTPTEVLDRLFEAAEHHAAVIPVLPVADTIKRVEDAPDLAPPADPLADILGDAGKPAAPTRKVAETVPRSSLVLVQTPQIFEVGLLRRAYAQGDLSSTDDAMLIERLGEPVVVIEGDQRSMKITTPLDLRLLRAMLGLKAPAGRSSHHKF